MRYEHPGRPFNKAEYRRFRDKERRRMRAQRKELARWWENFGRRHIEHMQARPSRTVVRQSLVGGALTAHTAEKEPFWKRIRDKLTGARRRAEHKGKARQPASQHRG